MSAKNGPRKTALPAARDANSAPREASPLELLAVLWVIGICAFFLRGVLQTLFVH